MQIMVEPQVPPNLTQVQLQELHMQATLTGNVELQDLLESAWTEQMRGGARHPVSDDRTNT